MRVLKMSKKSLSSEVHRFYNARCNLQRKMWQKKTAEVIFRLISINVIFLVKCYLFIQNSIYKTHNIFS